MSVVNCVILYFIIRTTLTLLKENGEEVIAARGTGTLILYFIFSAFMIVCNLISLVESLIYLLVILTVFAGSGLMITIIRYVGFLKKSAQFFESQIE